MRVAVYHNLPPGGARRMLWEFLRRTSDEHEYDLYTIDMGRADVFTYAREYAGQHDLAPYVSRVRRYPLLRGPVAAVPIGKLTPLEAVRRMPVVEREIAADINAGGYDAAYVHPCQLTHTPSLLRLLDVPSLHYMQEPRRETFERGYRPAPQVTGLGSIPRWGATTVLERTLRRRDILAAAAVDRIACNSYYSAECIRRAYGRQATVCYLGVDTDTFSAAPAAALVADRARPIVIAVGALDPVKGHDLVVRGVGLISADERPALHLVFERYDADYRREVEGLAHELGVELNLHQGISDDRLAALYRASSVTVLAAQLEPFGLVPLESLACGTPVVAVREAGYRETIDHGVNGYLADRSAGDIADSVRRVLRGELRTAPDTLRAGVVSQWNWDAAVKRQLELLSATAEGGRP